MLGPEVFALDRRQVRLPQVRRQVVRRDVRLGRLEAEVVPERVTDECRDRNFRVRIENVRDAVPARESTTVEWRS